MGINKFEGRPLIIKESKFVTNFRSNSLFTCTLCNNLFINDRAVVFHPLSKIALIFDNYRFCEECALKLIDNPDKVIFEYRLGLL